MNDDLISRQAALNIRFSDAINEDGVLYVPLRDFTSGLKALPTVDVRENIKGEWKEVVEPGLCDLRRCSNCGHIEAVGLEMITPKPNFCPNCGAQMVRGEP